MAESHSHKRKNRSTNRVDVSPSEVVEAVELLGSITAAAKHLGITRRTAQRRFHAVRDKRVGGNPDKIKKATKTEDENQVQITGPFRTWQEAMEWASLDPGVWELERCKTNSWSVQGKFGRADQGTERFEKAYNDQISYWFRRVVPIKFETALNYMEERVGNWSPKYPKIKYPKITEPHMLEISLFDVHFGKYAWSMEAGENYDLSIAEDIYEDAFKDLLSRARPYPIEKILIPIGQDFIHIDNLLGETTNGTQQNFDTRPAKIMDTAEWAAIKAIDLARQVAPVEVMFIPGNHDRQNAEALCRTLRAWYRLDDSVTVDVGPKPRKYVHYGRTLIGFTHGDCENLRDLPTRMADEAPADAWIQVQGSGGTKEFHIGHLHKKKVTTHTSVDTFGGTLVRTLPSLSATDAWHFRQGYVKGLKAAMSFVYSRSEGLVAEFTTSARPEKYQ